MKRFLIALVLILVAGHLSVLGLPWWSLAPISAMICFAYPQNGWLAFGAGFVAGGLLWGSHALWMNVANQGMFAHKIGEIFQGISPARLVWTTALMGALTAAIGALLGQWARDLFKKSDRRNYYSKRRRSGRYR